MKDMTWDVIEAIVKRIKREHNITYDKWIAPNDAMKYLGLDNYTRDELRAYCDTNKINYTVIEHNGIVLYDMDSILDFLKISSAGHG